MERTHIKKAIRRLREAKDRLPNLFELQKSPMADAFEHAWFEFLDALNSAPEILKTGVRDDPKARQWYASKDREIRSDPLLRYLLQSRGGDFHGPERVVVLRLSAGSHEYPNVTLDDPRDVRGTFDIPANVTRVRLWYELQPIKDQHGNRFDPPETHLGYKIFDRSPCGLGGLALDYYERLIREAEVFSA